MWVVGFAAALMTSLALWGTGALRRVEGKPIALWALLGTVIASLLPRLLPDGTFFTGGFIGGLFAFMIVFSLRLLLLDLRSGADRPALRRRSASVPPDAANSSISGHEDPLGRSENPARPRREDQPSDTREYWDGE
jgi:predicted lipid-binding transport protein (Tim44 family)